MPRGLGGAGNWANKARIMMGLREGLGRIRENLRGRP